jgi:hypothetical protein
MKYFTPALYLRFRSTNGGDALKAHDDWELAIEAYRKHLEEIGGQMTTDVKKLAQTLCLHDADYLGMALLPTLDSGKPLAVLLIRQNTSRTFLVYLLSEQPLTEAFDGEWPYSTEQVHWLYDEFDVDEAGVQQHEVLLSNGQIVTLRFHEMQIIRHDVPEPALVP